MHINTYLAENKNGFICRPVKCKDGFTISIQGSEYHYCTPKRRSAYYEELEMGFPSEHEPLLDMYAEYPETPKETIYAYVPVELVEEILKKHGGIDL